MFVGDGSDRAGEEKKRKVHLFLMVMAFTKDYTSGGSLTMCSCC